MTRIQSAKLRSKDIVELLRNPPKDFLLVSAHRGLRWNGVPENSKESFRAAAQFGLLCVEVDVRLTNDGHPANTVILHDEGLGRATAIAEYLGRKDVYNPFSNEGYNPTIQSLPWEGVLENVKLKNELGEECEETIMDVGGMLDVVEQDCLGLVIMLDIKTAEAIPATYQALKNRRNAAGVPALEWCIWKLGTEFYPTVDDLERAEWFRDALRVGNPLYIPVFEPDVDATDALEAAKAFVERPYVIAMEVGLRSLGGPLYDVVEYCRTQNISVGWFAALGDIHPDDGKRATDAIALDLERSRQPDAGTLCFRERYGISKYDIHLKPGQSADGRDHRGELNLYRKLGYRWVIADLTHVSAEVFASQQRYSTVPCPELRASRLNTVSL